MSSKRASLLLLLLGASIVTAIIVLSRAGGQDSVEHKLSVVNVALEEPTPVVPTQIANPPTLAPEIPAALGRLVLAPAGAEAPSQQRAQAAHKLGYPADVTFADWSPDGRSVLLTRPVTATEEVLVADSDGANLRSFGNFPLSKHAPTIAWSPDGTKIAWITNAGTVNMLYLLDRGQGTLTQMVEDTYLADTLAWSPDGHDLAHIVGWANETELRVLSIADGMARSLGKLHYPGNLAWGADGMIYINGCPETLGNMVCRIDPAAPEKAAGAPGIVYREKILSKTANSTASVSENMTIVGESPDKAWLMLHSSLEGELWIYNIKTGTNTRVAVQNSTSFDRYSWGVWSPDSAYVTLVRGTNPLTFIYQPRLGQLAPPFSSAEVLAWVR